MTEDTPPAGAAGGQRPSLATRRRNLRLRQADVAKMLGVDQGTLSRAETTLSTKRSRDLIPRYEALLAKLEASSASGAGEADIFWAKATHAPHGFTILRRLETNVAALFDGMDVERCARQLLDCLPADSRARVSGS